MPCWPHGAEPALKRRGSAAPGTARRRPAVVLRYPRRRVRRRAHRTGGGLLASGGGRRTMGRRGQRTRRRLLDSTATLLDAATYREVRVVDIARHAEMSPAAFYQYFGDVEAAVLALAEEMASVCGPELAALVREHPWSGPAAWSTALGVADGFLSVWDRHRAVLRVVDLATDEGDQRFRDLRTRFLREPSEALVEVLAEGVCDRGPSGPPRRGGCGHLHVGPRRRPPRGPGAVGCAVGRSARLHGAGALHDGHRDSCHRRAFSRIRRRVRRRSRIEPVGDRASPEQTPERDGGHHGDGCDHDRPVQ